MILLKAKIYGDVQGVGFRFESFRKAQELDIVGFAKNERDGTVYIEAQGPEENVRQFFHWLEHHGPPLAKVTKVEAKFSRELKDFGSFKIL